MVQSFARTATLIAAVAWNARSCVAAPVEPIPESGSASLAPSAVPTGSIDIGASSALQESTALAPSAVPTGSIDIGASHAPHQPKESGKPHPHECHPGPHSLKPHKSGIPSGVPKPSDDPVSSAAPSAAGSPPILPRQEDDTESASVSAVPSLGGPSATIPKPSGKPKGHHEPHDCGKLPGPHSHEPHSGMPSGIPKPSDEPVPSAAPSAAGSPPILPRQEDDIDSASVSAAPSLGGPSATIPKPSGKPKGHHEPHDCGEFPGPHSHEPHTGGPSSLKEPPHIPTPIPAGGASASAVPSSLPKRRNVMADLD